MPLLFSSLARIDDISRSMDLRRFGKGKRRSWYYQQTFRRNDWVVLVGMIVLVLLEFVLIKVSGNRFWWPI